MKSVAHRFSELIQSASRKIADIETDPALAAIADMDLDFGLDVGYREPYHGRRVKGFTPLSAAARADEALFAKILSKSGRAASFTQGEHSPLHVAALAGRSTNALALFAAGARAPNGPLFDSANLGAVRLSLLHLACATLRDKSAVSAADALPDTPFGQIMQEIAKSHCSPAFRDEIFAMMEHAEIDACLAATPAKAHRRPMKA